MRSPILRITHIIALLLSILTVNAQNSTWTHYSTDDGLTENSILSMYQDKQGFMWFGSFSGLNRFDGYKFKTYKALAGDKNGLKSDKIEYITEDNYGFIWIRTNEGVVYRLDKRNDKFQPIPQSIKPFEKFSAELRNIKKMSNGNLWLVATNSGCFKVEIDPNDYSIRCKHFSVKNGLLASDSVNNIFEDSWHNVWVLTKAGITEINSEGVIKHYFNNKINALSFYKLINIDKKEDILTASNGKLIKYDKQNKSFVTIQLPTTSNLRDIIPMRDKQYAIITENDGFFIYNYSNNQYRHFNGKDSPYLNAKRLNGYVDKYNELWLNSESDGILHLDPKTNKIRKLTLNTDKIGSYLVRPRAQIFEDIHNNLWIYPRIGGFSLYNRKTQQLEYFHNSPEDPDRWFSNVIYSYCSDNQGNLWLSTFSQGIEKITFYPTTFRLFKPMPTSNGVTDNEVRALCEDHSGNLWVAMRSGVVLLFDKDKKQIGYLGRTGKLNEPRKFEALVYAILVDDENNVWLGTKGDGLFLLKPQGNKKTYSIRHFTEGKDKYGINSNIIYALNQDKNGRVWVGTFDGGLNYIDETNGSIRFINSNNDLKQFPIKQFNRVRCITSNNNGLWVGTTSGLLYCNNTHTNPQNIRFQSYTRNMESSHSLSSNDICKILVTKKGQVLVGTIGGGLNILQASVNGTTFKSYNAGKNFPTDVILGMVEDKEGHTWISSENKLIKFEPQTSRFEVISKNYGIEKTNFSESTALKLQHNGEVLFGCNNGIYYFNPSQIKHKTYTPPLVFTGFTLFNKDSVSSTDASLEYNINTSNAITLKYNQSVFTIEFSALDFRSPNNILYAYKLESGDKSEYIIQKQRSVTFTKLQPGDYVFKVKSTNSEGIWVNNEREIHITILPPFWKSGWAYLIYTLLVIGIVILSAYILFVIFKLQNKVKMEEELTETKLQFFTEISHELRTPLTLISLPVENILNESSLPAAIKEQLSLIKRNVDRMVRLVNQILEFRKIEETGIGLTIEETKLGLFVKDVCAYYADIAKQKSLNIVITDNSNEQTVFIDKDKVDKIIYNILSNAFKYSPSNSEIHISIYTEGERIYVSIQDKGPGLSDKIKNKIFKLYQSTGNDNGMQTGTGIGLAFSKKLANAHKATLELESIANEGTCVKIGFLLGTNHFEKEDLLRLNDVIDTNINNPTSENKQSSTHADTIILVVEDNIELRQFMVNALRSKYHVIEASNGEEAIETGLNVIPDIIISDILMPKMDGLELARRIKEDINISHIPIILLTAKTDIESKLDALKKGVDDYITKPFSINYLEARIENLLKTREQLQSYFKSTLSNGTITLSKPEITSLDELFIDKTIQYLEQNYENSNMNIDDIALGAGVSRSSFFKKIKSLTGLAPVDFIREFRLQKALQIIEAGENNISQIAYGVGINDTRYFSKCFKQKYGMNPSEYISKYISKNKP
jgi:signal transduction histidine kinase/DNA-binding response OmpR family regulator/streptogramin lyase